MIGQANYGHMYQMYSYFLYRAFDLLIAVRVFREFQLLYKKKTLNKLPTLALRAVLQRNCCLLLNQSFHKYETIMNIYIMQWMLINMSLFDKP